MKLLAESEHYWVSHEYESVILHRKGPHKEVLIGDFYGDPQVAVISPEESYCAMGGCGIIVYFLRKPFAAYQYGTCCSQWKEWKRDETEGIMWVEKIRCLNESYIEVEDEQGNSIVLHVHGE